jgi:Leucine-rich repeat (LRR) protein
MSDIFISYAREDKHHAKRLADVLQNEKWSVWWDTDIPIGQDWRKVIKKELESARCVVVLWSRWSVDSDNVQDEAAVGRKRGILIPILIDQVEPPLGFGPVQTAELWDWDGTDQFPEFRKLIACIRALLSAEPTAEPQRRATHRADGASVSAQLATIAAAARTALGKHNQEPITDEDWGGLTTLELGYSGMCEAGLHYLAERKSLEYLDLAGNHITDAILPHVAALCRLEYLDLSNNSGITDAGLAYLQASNRLKHLNLSGTSVSGSGVRYLSGSENLTDLVLRRTPITIEGIDMLSRFPALAKLDLGNTTVDDGAIPHLERLVHLEYLGLRRTHISAEGRDRLKNALPRCRVVA